MRDDRLPMFPLNTVLFPGVSLPLHVFEDRYRALMHHLLAHRRPGRRGCSPRWRSGRATRSADHGAQSLLRVGMLVQLTEVERYADGRFDIEVAGRERIGSTRLDTSRCLPRRRGRRCSRTRPCDRRRRRSAAALGDLRGVPRGARRDARRPVLDGHAAAATRRTSPARWPPPARCRWASGRPARGRRRRGSGWCMLPTLAARGDARDARRSPRCRPPRSPAPAGRPTDAMAKKQKPVGTPATTALSRGRDRLRGARLRARPARRSRTARRPPAVLGVDPARVFKTLLAERRRAGSASASCRCRRSWTSRRWRPRSAARRRRWPTRRAERATGYVVGGISPLGQRRPHPTVVDASALGHPRRCSCPAGRRGLDVELAPAGPGGRHRGRHRTDPPLSACYLGGRDRASAEAVRRPSASGPRRCSTASVSTRSQPSISRPRISKRRTAAVRRPGIRSAVGRRAAACRPGRWRSRPSSRAPGRPALRTSALGQPRFALDHAADPGGEPFVVRHVPSMPRVAANAWCRGRVSGCPRVQVDGVRRGGRRRGPDRLAEEWHVRHARPSQRTLKDRRAIPCPSWSRTTGPRAHRPASPSARPGRSPNRRPGAGPGRAGRRGRPPAPPGGLQGPGRARPAPSSWPRAPRRARAAGW